MGRLMRDKESRKPRKLTLSPTKINTYLSCRLAFKFTYVDRIGKFFYKPKSFHTFGATLHRALDEFHKQGGAETQSADELIRTMQSMWTSAGYSSKQEEAEHLAAAQQFLDQYHSDHVVEGAKTIFTEKQLRVDMGEFVLMGRIDRIDEHTDGHIEIIDYKSGRIDVTEDEVRADTAMGVYSLLARRLFPNKRVTITIYALRSGKKATAEHTAEELSELEVMIRLLAAEIAQVDEDSVIEPQWKPDQCPWCDYLSLCVKRGGWRNIETSTDRTTLA
ncbi:MAG: PD-(D/E)XK nuclease family protein [Armatimonadetes bacterium]|nr:PD-(D/E)XK nuclease family protein [Armatimonadota bacterium]